MVEEPNLKIMEVDVHPFMAPKRWTPKIVAERLEEAARTMRSMPREGPKGFASSWPDVVHAENAAYGWNDFRPPITPPTASEITRMDEVINWLRHAVSVGALERDEVRLLLWPRAAKRPWKSIMRDLGGVSRSTAWARWMSAMTTLTAVLNARSGKKMFKQFRARHLDEIQA